MIRQQASGERDNTERDLLHEHRTWCHHEERTEHTGRALRVLTKFARVVVCEYLVLPLGILSFPQQSVFVSSIKNGVQLGQILLRFLFGHNLNPELVEKYNDNN